MSTQPKPYLTPEQYLEIERAAEFKSEYFDGQMLPMSGATVDHARIHGNVISLLGNQLGGRSCEVVGSDLRLRTHPTGPYFYPDIVVFCGPPKLADQRHDTLTDATAIIEILSPSTERYDRTFKFEHYQRLASLRDFIVVAQDRVSIKHKTRGSDGEWNVIETSDPDALIQLPSIDCTFRAGDAYHKVEFEPEQ